MSELLVRLQEDTKTAMKARDQRTVGVLRMVIADAKNEAIAQRRDLTDDDLLRVLGRAVKQRRDAEEQYRNGGRDDLADQEAWEIGVIERYLPQQLTEEELAAIVDGTLAELPEEDRSNLGKVMRVVMPKVQGRADGKQVNALVRERLG